MEYKIREIGTGGPVLFWGMQTHTGRELQEMEALLDKISQPCVLVAYEGKEWNQVFSPWKAVGSMENQQFSGGGLQTLGWLEQVCVPEIRAQYGENVPLFLVGYSLAGLFSLWALYESTLFQGAVCCSGSLWYPGWEAYTENYHIRTACGVYLSLGGREEKTKDPLLATIGDCTRRMSKRLESEPLVKQHILEWNKGGHFSDPPMRLAKGIQWLLMQGKEKGQ